MSGGLCLDQDVVLNGLVFNAVDNDGTKWIVEDIIGWWTIPEPEILDAPRASSDGSYESVGRYKSRVFTLTGLVLPGNGISVAEIRDKIIRACDLTRTIGWFVTHETDFSKGSRVVLSGAPQIEARTNGSVAFSIGLRAPDPIKYALNGGVTPGYYSQSTSTTMTITNLGNYSVEPIVNWTGSAAGAATLTNSTTGRVMQVSETYPIPGATTLTIDNLAKSVVIGSARNKRYYLKWSSDWLDLSPGDNTITITDGSVEILYRHGWIA